MVSDQHGSMQRRQVACTWGTEWAAEMAGLECPPSLLVGVPVWRTVRSQGLGHGWPISPLFRAVRPGTLVPTLF